MPEEQIVANNSETWNIYYPVNSTVYNPSNIVRLRIPKSTFVADLSRAFIRVRYALPWSSASPGSTSGVTDLVSTGEQTDTITFTNTPTAGAARNGTLVNPNAGCIFDIIEMLTDGKTLYHDDFSQASVTLNTLNKGEDYINSLQQTFVDPMKKLSNYNSQLDWNNLQLPQSYTANTKQVSYKNISIPLALLFPCFEHANDWPCFMMNDTIEFNLYVSRAYKYLVDYMWIASENHNAVRPVSDTETSQVIYTYQTTATTPVNHNITFYLEELQLDNISLHIPGHTPSSVEYAEINSIVNDTTGYLYTFRHWNIVNYLSRYMIDGERNLTQQVNFNVTTNNIFGVSMLALRPGTEVIFDKPVYDTIQVNLGSWELASNGTHLYDNYNYGGDMLQSVLDNLGQTNLQYYDVVQKSVIHDHSIPLKSALTNTTYYPTGSYMTYWDASPYNELGVGANEFSNLITYKYSVHQEEIGSNTAAWPIPNSLLKNAKTYCAINTCSGISITPTGIECVNPNSRLLSTDFINRLYDYSNQYTFRGPHGLPVAAIGAAATVLPKVIGWIPKIFTGIKNGIKSIRDKIRANLNYKHMRWYRERLTEKEIQDNLADLEHDSYYLFPKAWKHTYNKIIAARNNAHGILMRHGLKVRDLTLPNMGLGIKTGAYAGIYRPPRFMMGRLINWSKGFNNKISHGLCNTGHGLRTWWRRIWHKAKDKLLKYGGSGLDQGKNILQALLSGKITANEARDLGKQLLKHSGINILTDIQKAISSESSHGLSPHMLEKWKISNPNRERLFYNLFSRRSSDFRFRRFAKGKYLTTFPYKVAPIIA